MSIIIRYRGVRDRQYVPVIRDFLTQNAGRVFHLNEIRQHCKDWVADLFIPGHDDNPRLAGDITIFEHKVAWAVNYLNKDGYLNHHGSPASGLWSIKIKPSMFQNCTFSVSE